MVIAATYKDEYIKVGNINTRFRVMGEKGTAVMLVHGLGGSLENWDRNIASLSQQHRVYAMDLPGFGRSDKPVIKSMFDLVTFLKDFMDVQGNEKASVIGNSLGGGLVLGLAIQHPEKVEKVVLVSNAGMGRSVPFSMKLLSIPLIGELFARPGRNGMAELWRNIVYNPTVVTEEMVENTYQLAVLPNAMKSLLAITRAGINILGQKSALTRQLLEGLAGITTPTLIIWGKNDPVLPVRHALIAKEKIPNARLHVFDRCGHVPQLEYPEEFNKLALDFLAK
jgi:pimeloyl-ACP methyl ester carboxylesterase